MSTSPASKKVFDIALLKRVFRFAAPYKGKFILSLALAVFLALLSPIRPMLIQISINTGLSKSATGYFLQGPGAFLLEITLFQIFLLMIETLARFFFGFTTAALGQNVVRDLRVSTYNKILRLNLSQFDKTPIGTLTTRTINDIESVNDIFSNGIIPIIADLLSILSILCYMFWVDAKLTLICLAPFPILIVATYLFKESVNKSFIRVRNAVAALNAFVQEHITGMMLVQAFAAEDREDAKFRNINKNHRNANIRAIFAYSVFFPVVELISAFSIGLLVWWAAKESLGLSADAAANAGGVITSFILCINLLFRPLRIIADKFNVLQMGMIASERVFSVLDNPDITADDGKLKLDRLRGEVDFSKVWFGYDPARPVLKNINFHLHAGETLALVGHTGSGKTSIISLINRMYSIQQGQIKIDGEDINHFDLGFLRSKIGVVLQDVYLFSGSVIDNVTLRNPLISKEQVIHAAKLIGIHDFIEKLPGGYDFNVMERGATLSLGQRQLLSFVRALLYDPAILILDEATSSIDSESEQLIQQAIDKLISGRTSIIIAHRLSTIRKASQIMVLDKGEIMERGTHSELMNQGGHYAQLYRMQFDLENSSAG